MFSPFQFNAFFLFIRTKHIQAHSIGNDWVILLFCLCVCVPSPITYKTQLQSTHKPHKHPKALCTFICFDRLNWNEQGGLLCTSCLYLEVIQLKGSRAVICSGRFLSLQLQLGWPSWWFLCPAAATGSRTWRRRTPRPSATRLLTRPGPPLKHQPPVSSRPLVTSHLYISCLILILELIQSLQYYIFYRKTSKKYCKKRIRNWPFRNANCNPISVTSVGTTLLINRLNNQKSSFENIFYCTHFTAIIIEDWWGP